MATVDASIPLQVQQPDDYSTRTTKALQAGEAMQQFQGQRALREAFQGADMSTPEGQAALVQKVGAADPKSAMALQGQFLKQAESKSTMAKNKATTDKAQLETQLKKAEVVDDHMSVLMAKYTDLVQNKHMAPQDAARILSADIPVIKSSMAQQKMPDGTPMISQEELARMPDQFDPNTFGSKTMNVKNMREQLKYELDIHKQQNTEQHQKVEEGQGQQRIGIEAQNSSINAGRLNEEKRYHNIEARNSSARMNMEEAKGGLMADPEHPGKYVKDPSGGLSEDDTRFMARQYLAGDKSVLQNLGRGAQGARDLLAVRKAIRTEAEAKGMKPDEVASTIAEFEGLKSGERALGNRTATAGMAVNEASQFADLAVKASDKVNRTNYPSFNKILLAGEKGTGDKDVVQFGAYNNSLINAYARAISPSGTPTVSDKDHAREMLSTAYSKGQYAAVVDAMKKEMSAAMKSPGMVREEFRGYGKREIGPSGAAATPTKAGGTVHWDDLK